MKVSKNNYDSAEQATKDDPGADLQALKTKVVELFYEQNETPERFTNEADVCRDFSTVLLNFWHLCSIITFLVDGDGTLRECAVHTDEHTHAEDALSAAHQLAQNVRKSKEACDVWLDAEDERAARTDDAQTLPAPAEVKTLIEKAQMRAAFGVPINARGQFVGALVALTNMPADLRDARRGMRYIASPIIIAISNARRAAALREQRTHIDQLCSELQGHVAALEEANKELQRVARYRSLFLSRMSHELRTPLTSILGFAEILLDQEDLTPAQRRFCEKIQASGMQQQESLNALVDLSRLEAGHSELFLHEFSLREMLRESCAAVNRLARKAEVTLERDVADDLGAVVSDEGKLRQVLYNFLAFAIHRTPPSGHVRVRAGDAGREHTVGAPPRFFIEIADEGEPLDDLANIFEPFDAGHEPGAMPNARGTDMNELGLVIAHRLVNVLNGTVELHRTEPLGLRVRLTFPRLPPAVAPE